MGADVDTLFQKKNHQITNLQTKKNETIIGHLLFQEAWKKSIDHLSLLVRA